jgi:hypothetical protein
MESVQEKPAIHPPAALAQRRERSRTRRRRLQRSQERRMNCTGSQFTEASMFRPMISKAMKPKTATDPASPR